MPVHHVLFLFLFPDIDECQLGTDICINAECNNTAGSYTCTPSFPGFIPGNLTSCSEFYYFVTRNKSYTYCNTKLVISFLPQLAQTVTSG